MKHLLALALTLFLAVTLSAQSGSAFYHNHTDTNDTLGLNSTFTYDFNALTTLFGVSSGSRDITDTWSYSVTVEADSLSGSAADSSTVFLQVSNSPVTDSNPVWVSIEDDEIDGTATQVFHYTGDITEPRMRLLIYSKSGAKAIALRSYITVKRKYKTR